MIRPFYALNLSAKITLLTASMFVIVLGFLTIYNYLRDYQQVEEKFGWTLEHIAATAAVSIDGDRHGAVTKSGDENGSAFETIRAHLSRVKAANDLTNETIYTFHVVDAEAGRLAFAVMLHPEPFVGDAYEVPEDIRAIVQTVVREKRPAYTQLYSDDHGSWISGYAPILNEDGELRGILAVDYQVDRFLMALYEDVARTLLYDLGFVLLGVALSFWLSRRISRPVERLSVAARDIMEERYDFRLPVQSKDEIGQLTETFNSMAASLRERLLMFRYVPRHTKEMIRKLISGEVSAKGEKKNVAVLFSDIRGFTKFSSANTAEDVIAALNRYLGMQAEIIESRDGYVDKFVGDEVVAVFEGPDRAQNALRAAVEIHNRLEREAGEAERRGGAALHVGIGLSMGPVVMGNMGSAARQDYTVIGDNVNLAARLCSAAKPGEILLSSNIFRAVEDDEGIEELCEVRLYGLARVKGFAMEMHLYHIRGEDRKRALVGSI